MIEYLCSKNTINRKINVFNSFLKCTWLTFPCMFVRQFVPKNEANAGKRSAAETFPVNVWHL